MVNRWDRSETGTASSCATGGDPIGHPVELGETSPRDNRGFSPGQNHQAIDFAESSPTPSSMPFPGTGNPDFAPQYRQGMSISVADRSHGQDPADENLHMIFTATSKRPRSTSPPGHEVAAPDLSHSMPGFRVPEFRRKAVVIAKWGAP